MGELPAGTGPGAEFLPWAVVVLCSAVSVLFGVYIRERRAETRRLLDVIKERKADRDELLRTFGRIEAHLRRAELLEEVGRIAIEETRGGGPKRRRLDRAIAKATEAGAGELSDAGRVEQARP